MKSRELEIVVELKPVSYITLRRFIQFMYQHKSTNEFQDPSLVSHLSSR
jgi:hypothetical protein